MVYVDDATLGTENEEISEFEVLGFLPSTAGSASFWGVCIDFVG